MPFSPRTILMVALLPLVAGCWRLETELDYVGYRADKLTKRVNGEQSIPPGLEPLYTRTAASAPMADPLPVPVPPSAEALPFPAGRLSPEQAEVLLAGDPMALRFLALKQLAARGLVPVAEAVGRKDANMGALLPLTAPLPPAAGLDRPLPSQAGILERFNGLFTRGDRGSDGTRAAERAFLLDSLLPTAPAQRQPYSPPDIASARKLQDRLGRLEDTGLVTPDERARETAAVDQLIASGALPEVVAPPPPPEKPKAKKKAGSGRGSRMPGGVSGKLEVVPSPPGVEPPRLKPGSKDPAGLHLLSMGTASHGDKAWDALQKENPELAALGHTVSRADLGDLGVTYRLIAGPVEPAQAETLCTALKARGQACMPTPFPANGAAGK
ncbi:MAG: SPOR domain-containing protein [Magnetospirillum sp.]|nr:SPOR domain-containing protein [Magnetospirillum sp.]